MELLKAMPHVKSPIHLTVRSQNPAGLESMIKQVPGIRNDTRIQFIGFDSPYETLFDGFDVYVAPEKFNGLSLPLQEACAAGLLVMATNRFPMNNWLPTDPMIPVKATQKAQVMGGHNWFEESTVDPLDIARTIDNWYGKDITQYSEDGMNYANRNSWDILKPKFLAAIEGVL